MVYKLADYERLCKDYKAWSTFYGRFVREIVGKIRFDNSVRESDAWPSTRTDDALALVIYKNNEAGWMDLLEQSSGAWRSVGKHEKPQWTTTKLPLYTSTAKPKPSKDEAEKAGEEGKKREVLRWNNWHYGFLSIALQFFSWFCFLNLLTIFFEKLF